MRATGKLLVEASLLSAAGNTPERASVEECPGRPQGRAPTGLLQVRHPVVGPSTSAWRVNSTTSSASAAVIRNHGV